MELKSKINPKLIIVCTGLIVFSVLMFLTTQFIFKPNMKKGAIAEVTDLLGKTTAELGNTEVHLKKGDFLFNNQRIKTGTESKLFIKTKFKHELMVGPDTDLRLSLEKESQKNSVVYIDVARGFVKLKKDSDRRGIKIIQSQFTPQKFGLDISIGKPKDTRVKALPEIPDSPESTKPVAPVEEDDITAYSQKTLTNEQIQGEITGQESLLQRCQLNSIRAEQEFTGRIIVNFKIFPDGSTEDVKIQNTENQNLEFNECVKSVFERIRFQTFDGSKLEINYPMVFR